MADTDDAFTLVSDIKASPKEVAYAEYANFMKTLGNRARKEILATVDIKYDPAAKSIYRAEVDSLNAKLNISLKNQPLERMAQTIAAGKLKAAEQDNPRMTNEERQKKATRYLASAMCQSDMLSISCTSSSDRGKGRVSGVTSVPY